jgi:large subunit ribosomal protein L13
MQAKTYMAKTGELQAKWLLVDATDKVVGRMATKLAHILQGKHRPEYTPHVDTGDFIVVINAEKVKLTGTNKPQQRVYKSYSGYPSGQKTTSAAEMLKKHPDRVVAEAVRRMLPKSKLGRAMLSKLKVYAGSEHPHQAQQPQPLEL